MNRINQLFSHKKEKVLSVYFTAGFPALHDTIDIIKALEKSGVDMIEIGMPFSDPMADGPVIQQSSQEAIQNGMSITLLFEQLKNIRQEVKIPLLLMGYLNPVLSYGMERFCEKAEEIGIDGFILPDLPLDEYTEKYKLLFEKHQLSNIFLITPQTKEDRIRQIDQQSNGFIYMVASASITGGNNNISGSEDYFSRINQMHLKNPRMIGFGISDKKSFDYSCRYAQGAIIGTAFIKALSDSKNLETTIDNFCRKILN